MDDYEELRASSNHATIVIADDFCGWRARVREMLLSRPEWQIVGEACDGAEAVRKAAELHPDLVVLDIGMPVMNGIQAAKNIREIVRRTKIVFLTQENDSDLRSAALNSDAEGYVLKANAAIELLPAIASALSNRHREMPTAS